MEDEFSFKQAMILMERALKHQKKREFGEAIHLYRRSLEICPTAVAYTHLGWTYSLMERYDEAVEQCQLAIELEPDYANPYHDMGSYLIELKRYDEAIPWLEQALTKPNYDNPHFTYSSLGRASEGLGRYRTALGYYQKALDIAPYYISAIWLRNILLGKLN